MNTTDINTVRREIEESWMPDHREAMECRNLEEKIRVGLRLFSAIQQIENAYTNAVRTKIVEESEKIAESIESLHRLWLEPCPEILAKAKEMSDGGYVVDGKDSLQSCFNQCREKLHFDVAGTRRALEQAQNKQTIPRREAMNELRRRIFPAGA